MALRLVSINDLDVEVISQLLDRAEFFRQEVILPRRVLTTLNGYVVANLFFEPSTRTQYSFTVAAERLGAIVLNPQMAHSSLVKGESLLDTAATFVAMGTNALIIRHKEEYIAQQLADSLGARAVVINAGDGCHQHPTQALLDLLTIRQHKPLSPSLAVAIIGDISHSRVARSLIAGLQCVGVTDIRVIAPDFLLPEDINTLKIKAYSSLADGLAGVDVVVALRLQSERWEGLSQLNKQDFNQQYGLTTKSLRHAKPDAMVMHPGPINRGVEIDSEVADGKQSVILQQVANGVAVRMAVLEGLAERKYTRV